MCSSSHLPRAALCLAALVATGPTAACATAPALRLPDRPAVVAPSYPTVVARFQNLEALRLSPAWSGLHALLPEAAPGGPACTPTGAATLSELEAAAPGARLLYLQYPGCCETRCRRAPGQREARCGTQRFPQACRKDLLVEARGGRFSPVARTAFATFDGTEPPPRTRVFRYDLDADGAPETIRWEELSQHHRTEWHLQAFRGTAEGLRPVADIRFFHTGPWKPELDFVSSPGRREKEIEISVQDVDGAQHVVVRRHVYRYDPLQRRYVIATTEVREPPGLLPHSAANAPAPTTP